MAKELLKKFNTLLLLLYSSLASTVLSRENHDTFVRSLNPNYNLGLKQQKLSHFQFYWHDIVSGWKPSSVVVVPPLSNTSATAFGMLAMIDDLLTEEPELSSKLVGRAQGFYASAAQKELGLIMAMNFAVVEGKYNGSTITVMGRNTVFSGVRETPAIGWSGLLRFAKGYVQACTHKFTPNTAYGIAKYNTYILHY